MVRSLSRFVCGLAYLVSLSACGDSAGSPDARGDRGVVDSSKDAGLDARRFDSTVDAQRRDRGPDAPAPDSAVDAAGDGADAAGDSAADASAETTTVDQAAADTTRDLPPADTTADSPPSDSTADLPPGDTAVDTTVDLPPSDSTADGTADGTADSTVDLPPTSFSQVYSTVISPNCSCHISGISGGLSMASESVAYSNLVGIASTCSGAIRVVASDSANSLLYNKLEGAGPVFCGARMPFGGAQLSSTLRALVKQWIDEGAAP